VRGKVVESRINMDQVGMLQQMGDMPPPGQSEEASPPSIWVIHPNAWKGYSEKFVTISFLPRSRNGWC